MTFATWPLWGVFLSGISSPAVLGSLRCPLSALPVVPKGDPARIPRLSAASLRSPAAPRPHLLGAPHGSGVARGLSACRSRTQHDAFGLHRGAGLGSASLSAGRPEPSCGRTALCSAVRCAHGRARALGSPQLLWVRTREGDCASEANLSLP